MATTVNIPGKNDSTQKMATLAECVNKGVQDGYTENFKVVTKGLTDQNEKNFYKPSDAKIASFYRFEGYSSPEDNSILYLIETSDGKKGTLIDAYGAYADAKVSKFIRDVEDIHKNLDDKK